MRYIAVCCASPSEQLAELRNVDLQPISCDATGFLQTLIECCLFRVVAWDAAMKPSTLRRIYLREATAVLLMAKLAVRFVSSQRVLAYASRPPRRIRRFGGDEIGWVAWSVETIGSKPWMNALCLARAAAAQCMLRRRGIASRLCLGVVRDGDALAAYAWLEIGQSVVVGDAAAAGFTRVATFGGEHA